MERLSNQDRVNHTSVTFFVPTIPDSKRLDPKRSLAIYLEKVEQFRHKVSSGVFTRFYLKDPRLNF